MRGLVVRGLGRKPSGGAGAIALFLHFLRPIDFKRCAPFHQVAQLIAIGST
jgi:hypothetical protein